ncbi:MAG: cytochrome c-type biogenesis protein CcmH [Hyphomicrobiales bacterium]|jgi:cytochrome c-type biogenesis protein CcmH|nr:cytochrome c-type biogenesis protein CcmH [Hyphomicrobiales bacterium]|tara:strand:- start:106 stop:495 length:390 start_codon:yes stop_codon:yes gene_type:complete
MIKKPYILIKFLLIYLLSITFIYASNIDETEMSNEVIEISKELKCLVCDGQNIFESNSNFSKDIKLYINKELINGKEKKEIISDIHSKYGDVILMRPPIQRNTYILWFLPSVILFIGILILYIKRRGSD